jgi:hypothetical protein
MHTPLLLPLEMTLFSEHKWVVSKRLTNDVKCCFGLVGEGNNIEDVTLYRSNAITE